MERAADRKRGWLERWGLRLAEAAIDRPRLSLALGSLLTLALAPGLTWLELRTDGRSLVPPDDPVIEIDRQARERFGLRDALLVVLDTDHPHGIYTTETLGRLERLSDELAALPEIGPTQVVSLATERRGISDPVTKEFLRFLEPPPTTPRRLIEVRYEAESLAGMLGTLVSHDGTAAAIRIGVPAETDATGVVDRSGIYQRVAEIAQRYRSPGLRVHVVGSPAAETLLGRHLIADLTFLLPLSMAVIGVVLWWACGRLACVAIGLLKIGAAQVATLGLLGWLGEPLYLTTAITPVVLTAVGLAEDLHILSDYQRRLAVAGPAADVRAELRGTMGALMRPVILTSLTTAIGFASFVGSGIRPVSSFGIFTALGVVFCLGWALMLTPAALALLPVSALLPRTHRNTLTRRFTRWSSAWIARRRMAWAVLAVITVVLGLGVIRLEVQDSWIENFSPASELRQASALVDRKFDGTHVLHAVLTFDPPAAEVPVLRAATGPLLAGKAVRAVGTFEDFARSQPGVGGAHGLYEQLLDIAYAYSSRMEGSRLLSDLPGWLFLHIRRIAFSRGEERRRELIDDGYRSTVVTLLLRQANYQRTAALMRALRSFESSHLTSAYGRLDFAGDIALSQAMIPAIVRTQVRSVLLALVGNFLLCAVLARSARFALLIMIPTSIAVIWTFGLMGWLGIPLGVATSMFCAITLGIGIDFGIHLLERQSAAKAAGASSPAATALVEAGPAIVIDTLAIALGFGLLAVSTVPANARLGVLTAIALFSACALTLFGLGLRTGKQN